MNRRASERELALAELGFDISFDEMNPLQHGGAGSDYFSNAFNTTFGGYGEFKPITVRSETVIKDANVE